MKKVVIVIGLLFNLSAASAAHESTYCYGQTQEDGSTPIVVFNENRALLDMLDKEGKSVLPKRAPHVFFITDRVEEGNLVKFAAVTSVAEKERLSMIFGINIKTNDALVKFGRYDGVQVKKGAGSFGFDVSQCRQLSERPDC